jgi:hypothetical protein
MSIEVVEQGSMPTDTVLKPVRDVRIYIDTEHYTNDEKLQLYLQQEPEAIRPIKQYLLENAYKFHAVLTFDTDVLRQCKNAKLFTLYTVTWLEEKDYTNIDTSMKQCKISSLVGGKRMTVGHEIRLTLYFSQIYLNLLPIVFFRSCAHPLLPEITQNPFLSTKESSAKRDLFSSYQFHLAIENSRQDNYYTEKLIDCLISKTIPIYYGCPNIGDYFDTSGWILLEKGTPDELIDKCKVLHPGYYSQYTETIESNYKQALYRKEHFQRLNDVLRTIPGYL